MRKLDTAVLLACLIWVYASAPQVSHADTMREVCADFNSRVRVGAYVQVTSPALNIRSTPSTDGDRLRDPLSAGTLVFIDQGPECVDNYTWWQITVDDLQGWVAEGNPDRYFLSEPVDPDQVRQNSTGESSGEPNRNVPLATLDGRPGGGNYEYACRGVDDGLFGRDPSTSSNVSNGAVITFIPSLNMLEVDTPAICLGQSYSTDGSEAAFAPNGSIYQPTVTPVFDDDGNFQYTLVQLPPDAFFQFGRWELSAQGFTLSIDILPPARPYVMYTFLDNGIMLVGGLKPNERFIVNGTGNEDDTTYSFEAQADGNGVFVTPLRRLPWYGDLQQYDTNSLYASVTRTDIIGQQGSFMTLEGVGVPDPATGYEWFRIPVREAAPLMREIVWGGQYDESSADSLLQSWTCPGAAPIRISRRENESASVIGGSQHLYREPSIHSQVSETVQSGDRVFVFDGVQCSDNGVWWETGDGWLMESQNGQYLWEPS